MKYGEGNKIPSSKEKTFPVYGANGIVSYYEKYNNEDTAIVGHIGTVGEVVWAQGKHFVTYNGIIVEGIKGISNNKFIYHLLCYMNLKKYKKGSQPFLSISDFEKSKYSLPSISTQNKIVKILDSFESLCQDLSIGLPAEQQKRQQ
ncbi:hypothetical protein C4M96_01855 [Mycoplasmopsis pullorum]|uniref:restriction endonuclease subunit S n=1 Tax=Mycoplasmopsis pullorum TaxID=48003 RepID=UPI001118DC24|nr:restriction endonuclease subunit S [Mycoplasmopsis pullorum]TNK92172.1 hypothetical protein C4M96_01855 [Mycoplasmopsis pullorum]